MKKEYLSPEMEVLELELQTFIAKSDGTNVSEEDYEQIGGEGQSGAVAE